jgi:hypothetical protein
VVRSQWRRHQGPTQTTILGPHRPETVTAREVVGVYVRRWCVALLCKERNGVGGLGQPQVTTQTDRVERAVAVAIMASLLLLKRQAKDIPTDRPWSAFRLHQAWAWEGLQAPCDRSARQMAWTWFPRGKAA